MPAPSQSSTPSRQIQCGHELFIPTQFLKCKRFLHAGENIFSSTTLRIFPQEILAIQKMNAVG
jgi:hypothetical protein